MKVGIELSGLPASDRARGAYLVEGLRAEGIHARILSKTDYVDIRILLSRDYERARNERLLIFDVSDAILIPPNANSILKRIYQQAIVNRRIGAFFSRCDGGVVASKVQANSFRRYNNNLVIIPDASFYHVDFDFKSRPPIDDRLVFVWDGQVGNYVFIDRLIAENVDFFRRADVELKIITDKKCRINGWDIQERLASFAANLTFVEWTEAGFIKDVNTAHVGLAPLNLSCQFACAKPENKLVNYVGLGLPAISSATLAYSDFSARYDGCVLTCVEQAEWRKALELVYIKRHDFVQAGLESRSKVIEDFSPYSLSRKWADFLRRTCGEF